MGFCGISIVRCKSTKMVLTLVCMLMLLVLDLPEPMRKLPERAVGTILALASRRRRRVEIRCGLRLAEVRRVLTALLGLSLLRLRNLMLLLGRGLLLLLGNLALRGVKMRGKTVLGVLLMRLLDLLRLLVRRQLRLLLLLVI